MGGRLFILAGVAVVMAFPVAARETPPLGELSGEIDQLAVAEQVGTAGNETVGNTAADPALPVPPPPLPDPVSPDILGAVGVPVRHTRMDERWKRVTEPVDATSLSPFTAPVSGLAPVQQAAFVQGAVNRTVAYRADIENWGRDDHWATAEETLARGGGDCEDLAIVKMQALRQLGFEARDLYLAIGVDKARVDHALLLVRLDGRFWALDDRSNKMVDAGQIRNFRPTMTMGSGMAWIYGAQMASRLPASGDLIAPAGGFMTSYRGSPENR